MVIFENIDIDIDINKANLKNIDIDIDKEILVNIDIDIDIDKEVLENIDIDIDIDKEILENIDIDIDKEISENIDIDKISNRLEFGISNRASNAPPPLFTEGFRKKVFGTILYIKPGSTVHIVSTIRRPQEGNEGNHAGKVEVNSADLVTQQKFLRPLPPR